MTIQHLNLYYHNDIDSRNTQTLSKSPLKFMQSLIEQNLYKLKHGEEDEYMILIDDSIEIPKVNKDNRLFQYQIDQDVL